MTPRNLLLLPIFESRQHHSICSSVLAEPGSSREPQSPTPAQEHPVTASQPLDCIGVARAVITSNQNSEHLATLPP